MKRMDVKETMLAIRSSRLYDEIKEKGPGGGTTVKHR